jgi:uncharacterized protein
VALHDPNKNAVSRFSISTECLNLAPIEQEVVLQGSPCVGWKLLGAIPGVEVGIWEHTPGTSTDVEEHEAFVVVAGHATVVLDGGARYEFGVGDVGFLAEGTATTWIVHETFRKVFVGSAG